ncbi:MAG: hypothetical protein ABGY11_11100 [Candidatus Thioglobus sp.]|jgi:hypothetical protein
MARKLSKQQKQMLNRFPEVDHFDSLPKDVIDSLYKLRDYETLHSDATRYLNDQRLGVMYGK